MEAHSSGPSPVVSPYPPLSGGVLVGGRSRRMGRDKALLVVQGRTPLISVLVDVLGSVCDEVLLVGGDSHRFSGLALAARWTPDASLGRGPLAGILGGLAAAHHEWCLIVACDMPFVTRELVAAMAAEPRDCDVLAYPRGDGFEPLLAIYSRKCIRPLKEMLSAGEMRAQDLARRLRVRALSPEILARADPAGVGAVNVNTEEELVAARGLSLRAETQPRP